MREKKNYKQLVTDREIQRLRSLATVLTKTNRILTGDREVTVHMQTSGQGGAKHNVYSGTPGYTISPNIYINYDKFDNFQSQKTLIQLLGLDYHELSHHMFTPREFKMHIQNHLHLAFNILEDQRIESLFTALYEPAGKYFTEMIIKFMVDDPNTWESAFAFTYGRSYLPLEIREEFEARYKCPADIRSMKNFIDKYKRLKSSDFEGAMRNNNKMQSILRIIKGFNNLLLNLGGMNNPPTCESTDPHTGAPDKQQEEEASEKDQSRRKQEKETGEDQSGFWEYDEDEEDEEDEDQPSGEPTGEDRGSEDSDEESDEAGDDDGEDGVGSGEDSEVGEGDDTSGSDDNEGSAGDGDEVSGSEQGENSGEDPDSGDSDLDQDGELNEAREVPKPGHGDGTSTFDDNEFSDYLDEIIEAVHGDEDVNEELGRINNAINDSSNIDVIDFGEEELREMPVGVEESAVLRKTAQEFRRLYAEVEPGWRYGSDVGKLNVGRAMSDPDNYEEHFDEWDEGREHDVGLEVFIALDLSGSMMGDAIHRASQAMWILKRSLDEVDAMTTVVGFHVSTVGLYDRKKKAARSHWPLWLELGADTAPAHSFHLARSVLARTDMPNKLFIVITDGGWSPVNRYRGGIEDMGGLIASIPGTRMYVGIGGYGANLQYESAFDVAQDLHDPMEIVPLVRQTVTKMLKESASRRG